MTGQEVVPPRRLGSANVRGAHQCARPGHEKDRAATRSSVQRRRQRRTEPCYVQCTDPRDGIRAGPGRLRALAPWAERHRERHAWRWRWHAATCRMNAHERRRSSVSHRAIAAVLARTDLSMGERLVALSLASFANREERAFPGNAAARRAPASVAAATSRRASSSSPAGSSRSKKRGVGRGQATNSSGCCSRSSVRGGTARSTRPARSRCSPTPRLAGLRACCSRRWPPSPTSRAWSTSCRPTSSVGPPVWRTAPTAARAALCSPAAK